MPPLPHSIEYISSLMQRDDSPLRSLEHWKPIRIDALGLVTLLGAEEVNKSVGALQRRRLTEWLPLLAAFVVAGDRFSDEQTGYALYNVTDGIHTTELKGWFTRWLSSQDIRNSTTIFRWKRTAKSRYHYESEAIAPVIAFIAIVPLLVFTVLIGDRFGLGNCLAIIVSVFVRKAMLWQRRTALNGEAVPEQTQALPMHNTPQDKPMKSVDTFAKQLHRLSSQPSLDEIVTMFVTRADGRMVTIYAPRNILSTFIKNTPLPSESAYRYTQWLGWTAFGAHIIVLGMSSLFTQVYTVVLLVLSTWAMCHGFDYDTGRECSDKSHQDSTASELIKIPFTSCLSVEQENPPQSSLSGENIDKRMMAYIRAEPTAKQEAMLKHWCLLPFDGVPWYGEYERLKTEYQRRPQVDLPKPKALHAPTSSTSTSSAATLTPTSSPSGTQRL
jgi:hypothetical protein